MEPSGELGPLGGDVQQRSADVAACVDDHALDRGELSTHGPDERSRADRVLGATLDGQDGGQGFHDG
ncbi:hypothetical protein [Actinomadura rubrisoli]|uniref:Uncharacterized protein n=1 Tax=Actinomadura rubrisoli TaxID=2530368 RepID=A0A4R5BNS3_9ACTN|nr:hypothetical protein [Actinomadura rubrisoli]TDD87545.1 hypothetical protein E1298_16070 [Actinomadura rubrisoli]